MNIFNFIPVLLNAEQELLFSEGKSWTVIAVMLIIWAGIVGFMILMERRIAKFEKRVGELTNQETDS